MKVKARIKKTGEIKEINEENISLWDYARGMYKDKDGNKYHWKELEFIEIDEKPIDWEQRRYEIAKEMLPVIFQETKEYSSSGGISDYHDIPKLAVDYADLLIAELKKGGCNGSH